MIFESIGIWPLLSFQINQNLSVVSGRDIDNTNTGTPTFQTDEEKETLFFVTRKTVSFPIGFSGPFIKKDEDENEVLISQDLHIEKLKTMDTSNIDHGLLQYIRGELLFTSQSSLPDVSYEVSKLCQVRWATTPENIKYINEAVRYLQNTKIENFASLS